MAKVKQPIAATIAGTRLELIECGDQRLSAILALIDGARESVKLLFYMFTADDAGAKVRDALVRAAARGVEVRLLVDGFGCSNVKPEFLDPLQKAGGRYCIFHARYGRRYLIRNHQKIAIADDRRALIGGSNINDHYMENSGDQHWRDLWLALDGPAVPPLARYFRAIERWSRLKKPKIRALRRMIDRYSQSSGALQWKLSGPMRRANPWPTAIVRDILAGSRLDMVVAYFSPSRAMLRRIGGLAQRGPARIVTAAKSDNMATIAAARYTYKRLLKCGVSMFEYQPARLHTKLYIVDDAVHIGSSNFDFRSIYLNLEIMLRIEDKGFARSMRAYVDGEVADSLEIDKALHSKRATPWRRIKWWASHLLVTTMDYTVTRRINFGFE